MPDGGFIYGLQGCLAIALLLAAFTDLRRRQIDNWLTAAVAACAPLFWWATSLSLGGIAWQFALAAATFLVAAVLFARGGMGGGDVKLLVALALWLPPAPYFQLLFMMSIVGGAMSIVAGVRNTSLSPEQSRQRFVAALGAALWVGFSFYVIGLLNGMAPVDVSRLAAAIAPGWFGGVLVAGAVVALFALLISGAAIISRNQRRKLPIPYGLAISAAGLWILGPALLTSSLG